MFLICQAGRDLMSSVDFSFRSADSGRLYHMLERDTEVVMKMYVSDMRQANQELYRATRPKLKAAENGYKVRPCQLGGLRLRYGYEVMSDDDHTVIRSALVSQYDHSRV
jgi:hypothetical protein